MLNSTTLEILYATLPESALPWVTRSLTANEAVCDALNDVAFAESVSKEFQNNPLLWTPGNLALFSLNTMVTAQDLQAVAHPTLPQTLKTQAAIVFESLRNEDFSFLSEYSLLAAGGLIGLHLRVSTQVFSDWRLLLEVLDELDRHVYLQKAILSTLFSFVHDQKGFLKTLFADMVPNDLQKTMPELVAYAVYTNSLPDTSLINLFGGLLQSLAFGQQVALIEAVGSYSAVLAAELANNLVANSGDLTDEQSSVLLQLAQQREKSAKSMINRFHAAQNEAISKLLEVGLSATKEEKQVQASILNEVGQTNHLNAKNDAGRKLLKVLVNGLDSLRFDGELRDGSKTKDAELSGIPECAFYRGIVAIQKGNEEAGFEIVVEGLKSLKSKGRSIVPFLTTVQLIKQALTTPALLDELNETLYELFPENDYAKREVLKTYTQKGMHEKAIPVNLALVSSAPGNTDNLVRLAENYAETEQWEKSYKSYTKALKKEPKLPSETKFHYAKVCLNNHYFEKAEEVCESLLDEDFEAAHSVLATISKETKNYPKMVHHLNKAIEVTPSSLTNWHELVQHYMNEADFEAATPVVNKGLDLFPADSALLYFKGVLLLGLKQYADAVSFLTKSLATFDGSDLIRISKEEILKKLVKALFKAGDYETLVDVAGRHLQRYPDAIALQKYYALGLVQTGEREEGLRLLEQLVLNGEDSAVVLETYLQFADVIQMQLHPILMAYLQKIRVFDLQIDYAEVLIENEHYAEALDVLQLEKKHMQSVAVIKNVLLCAFKLGRQDLIDEYIHASIDVEALSFFEIKDFVSLYAQAGEYNRVLDLLLYAEAHEEKSIDFVLWFATSLDLIGRRQNAIDSLQEMIEAGADSCALYSLLGTLHYENDDRMSALNTFELAIEANDVSAVRLREIADFFGTQDDGLNQIRFLKEALQCEADVSTYYALAQAYRNEENDYEALTTVQMGLGLNAMDLDSLVLQGELLKALERPNAALESIKKALSIAPQRSDLIVLASELQLTLGAIDEAYMNLGILAQIDSVESKTLIGYLNFFTLHFDEVMDFSFVTREAKEAVDEESDIAMMEEFEAMRVFTALLLDRDAEIMPLLNQHVSKMRPAPMFYALQSVYLAKQGDLVTAMQSFEQGFAGVNGLEGDSLTVLQRYLRILYLAVAAAWIQRWELAKDLFAQANEIYPATMVQNYVMVLMKLLAGFVEPIYDFVDVRTRKEAMLPFMKHFDLEIHRLQSVQLKSINRQQLNFLLVLNDLMAGKIHAIETLHHSFEECAFLLGNQDVTEVKRLIEMKPLKGLSKLLAGAVLAKKKHALADEVIDTMGGLLNQNPLTNAMMAIHLGAQGAVQHALDIWRGAIEIWDDEPKWLGRYAGLLAQVGMTEKAVEAYEKGLAIDSNNVAMTLALGKIHAEKEDFSEATDHYAKAVQKGMNDSRVYAAYAHSLQQMDQQGMAVKMAIKAIEQNPNDVDAVLNYAGIMQANADFERAMTAIKKAKSMDGTNLKTLALEVQLLEDKGKFQDAIEVLNDFQKIKKLSKDMRITQALLYAKNENEENAIAILTAMLKQTPNDSDVAFALFEIYLANGNHDGALKMGQIALQEVTSAMAEDDKVRLYTELAKILHSKGQLDQAVYYLDEAIKLSPKDAALYLEMAEVFVKSRQYERAINCLTEATRLGIHTIEICVLAADLYEKSMDYLHAEEMLKKAVALDPKNVALKRRLKTVIVQKIVGQRGE